MVQGYNCTIMRILLTGASGLLGEALVRRFSKNHDVTGWCFSQTSQPFNQVDIRDPADVDSAFRTAAPNLVIHSAAARDPDWCETHPDESTALNVDGTRHVVEAAKRGSADLVYISTDYVFDGERPPYAENAYQNPINHYGETKLQGEHLAAAIENHLIVRIPILYGPGGLPGKGLQHSLKAMIDNPEPRSVDDVAIRAPTLTDDVADVVAHLLEGRHRGTFHVTTGETLTRYTMTLAAAGILGLNATHLSPGPPIPQKAKRPRAVILSRDRLTQTGFRDLTPFAQGIKPFLSSMVS